jgi:hypothetical protein
MSKNKKYIEDFDSKDWEQVSKKIPTKNASKCYKRWLFIQKIRGNKNKWTSVEDEALKSIIEEMEVVNWSVVSEKLNAFLLAQH